jgi:ParB-like chromosome segregation protein Spo0J
MDDALSADAPVCGVLAGGDVVAVPDAYIAAGDSPRLDGEDLDHIRALAQDGISWPPILVHRETMRVVDGMHRLRAARLRGDQVIRVTFFDGDEAEAFVAAVRANVAHGLPLKLADREAAAARIITLMPERSDRWIGEATGLAAGTVAALRRRSGIDEGHGAARVGKDGRVRPLDMAEGRLRAREVLHDRPDASLREIARAAGISVATAKNVRDRMRRGEHPVPGYLPAQARSRPDAGLDERRHQRAQPPSQCRNLAWSLQQLMKDPSLRYNQKGRTLLQWLQLHARGPGPLDALAAAMPGHCKHMLAVFARQYAREWQEFAATLDKDLSHGGRK